jgi:glycosyltransferase involved in cell wall biosynthesis
VSIEEGIRPASDPVTTGRLPVTLCVSVRNAAEMLPDCVASCADWVSEIVVVDMESNDATVAVARGLGARVIEVPNAGFAEPGRQQGIDAASQPWVLVLDADERAAPGVRDLVRGYVERNDLAGVFLPRQNYIFGRWIRHSGYWPDHKMRLFRPQATGWPPYVHTQAEIDGHTEKAPASPEGAIVHHNYSTIREWVDRNNGYTDLEVDRYLAIGRRASIARLLLAPPARFLNTYVRHQGFRDGFHGFAIAVLMAFYGAIVELKLWERQRGAAVEARESR